MSFLDSRMSSLQVVLSGKCADHERHAWTTCCSCRQSPDEARSRDGSFDRWDVEQAFSLGWKMHHAHSLSRIAESQAVWCDVLNDKCGRHIVDHTHWCCKGISRCRCHVLDHWRELRAGTEGARVTYSVTGAGAAEERAGAGAKYSITGADSSNITGCAGTAYSVTEVGRSRQQD